MTTKKDDTFLKLFRSLSREDKEKLISQGKELKKEEVKKKEQQAIENKKDFERISSKEGYIRMTFRFSSAGTKSAHESLFIQAIIDGARRDIDKMHQILYNAVDRMYGEAVVESGKFSVDPISHPEFENYQIRYRRSENENWKIWR
jgi:hypothetical protein